MHDLKIECKLFTFRPMMPSLKDKLIKAAYAALEKVCKEENIAIGTMRQSVTKLK